MIKKIKYVIIAMLVVTSVMNTIIVKAASVSTVTNIKTTKVTKTFKTTTIQDADMFSKYTNETERH